MNFSLIHNDIGSKARAGLIKTAHGTIETPVFMPVGTTGAVKAVHIKSMKEDVNAKIILGNTYHLFLRPGAEVIRNAGGLHKFNGWDSPILTDSGGFQVYSLSRNRKVNRNGVVFSSHIDGSKHEFTPENVMDIQRDIGSDIMMTFDECTPYPCSREYAEKSLVLTHNWLERCVERFNNTDPVHGFEQYLFGIVQGSVYSDLREKSAETIASHDLPGNAIGGLSVGEPEEMMYGMTDKVCSILPVDKPRYLMGVGTPVNLLECIALGVDMFDCVIPTRNARHGLLYTREGIINIKNEKWKNDFSPLDKDGYTFADNEYSKAFLRHMFVASETLAGMIASLHNLGFYIWLMKTAREKIRKNEFADWKKLMVSKISNRL